MKKIIDWLTSYKRHYIQNGAYLYFAVFFIIVILLAYNIGYSNGWDDSFELFNKIRPHRPLIG